MTKRSRYAAYKLGRRRGVGMLLRRVSELWEFVTERSRFTDLLLKALDQGFGTAGTSHKEYKLLHYTCNWDFPLPLKGWLTLLSAEHLAPSSGITEGASCYCCGRSRAPSNCIVCVICKTPSYSPQCAGCRGHLVNWDHIKCSKLQLLHQLGGCGILGVGIWLAVTQGNFATLSSSFPSLSAANLLIVTGTFVMIIGFVGCIGAIKENKCFLLSFFIMLLIIFLLELTVVILFFVYTDKIDKYAQRDLKKGLHLYGTDGNIGLTNAWSIIQTDFRCCGVSNYTDWFEVYNTTRVPDSCCLEFSENCGLHSPGTWWKAPCYETVKVWLQENLLAVGIFGLCTAMVQILGLTFAMTMYCQVVKADTYCA
ncbi:tetraspanin-4 isoform X1 [Vidua macroura]|uniref:tetraspanin-4 isoform X1 n=2 Tax=Vidua macroura TaxID=187451 RepID=UPI0023A89851|nr:tetraspanin-4 isoform X1 [Vidua macroura]